jgi:hypothetical protein
MLLVLLLADDEVEPVRVAIEARPERPERIHVVAPALVGPLAWLATADDDAQRKAEARVLEVEWTLADEAPVEGEAGDVDPVQAVEDALRGFPADEILVAGPIDADTEEALRRFGLPVSRLEREPPRRRSRAVRAIRRLAGGHDDATPFVLFFGVNAVLFLVGIVLSALVVVLLWLIGEL